LFFFLPGRKAGNPVAETKKYGYRNTYPDNSKQLSSAGFPPAILTTYFML